MKKIFGILTVVLAMSVCGCKKFLDQQPLSQLSAGNFWKSPDDINSAVAGIYSGIQGFIGADLIDWGEGRSDNYQVTQYGPTEYGLNGLTSTDEGTDWSAIYTTINRVNVALQNIPKVPDPDSVSVNDALGQCYAIRAYCYFWLVRVWGDAPVWVTPYTSLSQDPNRARTPADSILRNVILPDLNNAAQLINPNDNTVWNLSQGAIYSMMTDVYMWMHDYQNAIVSANKLFALKQYKLDPASNWKNLFISPTSTTGNIWSLHWDYLVNGGCGLAIDYGAGNTNNRFTAGDTIASYFLADTADNRGLQTMDYKNAGYNKIWKFYPANLDANGHQIYPTNSQANIYVPLYRLADIYLLYAEALDKTGDEPGAIKYLNMIHTRAGLQPYTIADFPDSTSLLDAILWERQVELFGEGKRWFDLVRNGLVDQVMSPVINQRLAALGYPPTGFGDIRRILFPINRNVLDANPLLIQNPPYSN